ncbi:MAG: magnesium and cobalt exporter, family [Actinomycetota bacterium]|nr:magnesium and cobalt exporter, family [Actinomycetota bacterium]
MNPTLANALLVLCFLLVGAFFAGSEIALVSLREGQVKSLATRGRRGQKVAELHADPNRFLAAVQIGVTLAGFLSAAFGASAFADDLAPVLERRGMSQGAAYWVAFIVVTLVITYLSLVISELAPKRIALQRAEAISLLAAPILDRLARMARPVIWLLSKSTDAIVRLTGGDPDAARDSISEEELRDIVAAHETLGREERQLIEDVFEAGERQLHEVMVPRTEVDFLDASMPVYKAIKISSTNPHSRYPVVRGSHDEVVGFVHVRDLFAPDISGQSVRIGDIAREVKMMPGTKRVLSAMSEMRREGHHMAIVVDEYGGTDGIVTLEDLMEEIIGEITDEYDVAQEPVGSLVGGDMEVDGLLNLEDFEDRTGIELPEGPYETVAGFIINELGRLPQPGETVEAFGHRFTVTELDGRRIARVRLTSLAPESSDEGHASEQDTRPGASPGPGEAARAPGPGEAARPPGPERGSRAAG